MPRRSQRAADEEADTHVNGRVEPAAPTDVEPAEAAPIDVDEPPPADDPSRLPVVAERAALPMPRGPIVRPDPGLYAVLGLDPSASDVEIQTTYRRQAAKLMGGGTSENHALKQLNIAYEVLANPVRRAEYDRLRVTQALMRVTETPARTTSKVAGRVSSKRRRPRNAVQPRYAGMGDVFVVLTVVGLSVVVGFLLIPRLSVNLSALNALQAVLPLSSNPTRRVIDATVTPAPTAQATATPLPSVSARYASTNVSVSNPTPAQNSPESVQIRLRRDGQAVPGAGVWASVQYRTTEERWPPTGSVQTDANGSATINFNIGAATPNYPVNVHVFAQVEDTQLSWATTFTPH